MREHISKAPAWLARAGSLLVTLVYPALCPACRNEIADDQGLCPDCWRETSFIAGHSCAACGIPVTAGLGEGALCDDCSTSPRPWRRGASAIIYEDVGRRLILGLKHGDRLDVAPLAAQWMLRVGGDLVDRADCIAPVPLHWRRMLRRKFNQSGELAREIADQAGREDHLVLDLLKRCYWSGSQDGRSRSDRQANVESAFSLPDSSVPYVAGKSVLLVDDVMTTGATLSACAALCQRAGAKEVNILVLARVAREGWPT